MPLGIVSGLFLGKQAGIMALCWLATRLRLATLAVLPMVTSPDDWPAYFAAENAKWRDMIRARNIRVQ